MVSIGNSKHPVWPFLERILGLAALVAILYINANKFDESEIKVILQQLVAMVGLGAIGAKLAGKSE
jgi:hypothetical protein